MKACYVEVYRKKEDRHNLFFTTAPTSPKEAFSIAEDLSKVFAKDFQKPSIEILDRYRQETNLGVEINVWELGNDKCHKHIFIKESK